MASGLNVNELDSIDRFLHGILRDDVTVQGLLGTTAAEIAADIFRVWTDVMPEGALYPGVVMNFQAGNDTVANGKVRVLTRPLYLIKCCTEGPSYLEASDLATAVGQAIEGASGTIGEVKIGGIYRSQPFRSHEVRSGVRYNFVGGLYRIFVSK